MIVIAALAVALWFRKTFVGPESVKPLLATAVLMALAYCAARPLPTKSSYSHMNPPVMPHWLCQPLMMLCTWAGVSSASHKPGHTGTPPKFHPTQGLFPAPPGVGLQMHAVHRAREAAY